MKKQVFKYILKDGATGGLNFPSIPEGEPLWIEAIGDNYFTLTEGHSTDEVDDPSIDIVEVTDKDELLSLVNAVHVQRSELVDTYDMANYGRFPNLQEQLEEAGVDVQALLNVLGKN